jgi:lauroyl/myristoyl acyltransferase
MPSSCPSGSGTIGWKSSRRWKISPKATRATDAAAMNHAIERLIADDPAPYWWALDRFRKRPPT